MSWPALKTYDRLTPEPVGSHAAALAKAYLGLRLLIGALGVALPVLLVAVDWLLLDDDDVFRGSMSAYYHSPARDLFVGGLTASGVILVGYMFWKWWTWDFILSFFGGAAILVVAFFPTRRPDLPKAASGCDFEPATLPCTALQDYLGEGLVRGVHLAATATVVICFASLCLVFALRDFGYGQGARNLLGWINGMNDGPPGALGVGAVRQCLRASGRSLVKFVWQHAPRAALYLLCLLGVIVGAAWAVLGFDLPWLGGRELPHTYGGEFLAFFSFGMAWIVGSWDLLNGLGWLDKAVTAVGSSLGVDGAAQE